MSERQNPFQTVSIDLITDLPNSKGYDSILTVVDHGGSKAAVFLSRFQRTVAQSELLLAFQLKP
jgi:hypothetical protein